MAHRVQGASSPKAALDQMLEHTGLVAVPAGTDVFRLEPARRIDVRVPRMAATAIGHRPSLISSPASGEIIVTGTKRALAASDVPFGVAVVGLADCTTTGPIPGTTAALGLVSELTLTNQGPGRNRLFIRGVADSPFNGPTQTTVSQFFDDARISYSAPDPDLRLVDIERVEVLAGPQGTLYGTGSLGGIYRIVPAKPDPSRLSGDTALEATAVAHGGMGVSGDAVLNVPLVEDRLAVRAVGYRALHPGWIADAANARAAIDVNRVETLGGRVALRWMPTAGWTFDAGGALQTIAARDSQYAAGPFGPLARATNLAEPHDNRFAFGTFALHGHLGSLTLDSTTAFVHLSSTTRYDATLGGPRRAFDETRALDMITHETRLANAAARWPWLVGAALLSTESDLGGAFQTGKLRAPVTNNRQGTLDLALFGETTVPIARALGLTVGGRVFQTLTHARELGDETEKPVEERVRHLSATPSVALLWRPAPRMRVYARFASAIRPGGISPGGGEEPRAYEDDDLESVEAGVRHSSHGGALALDLNAFALRWRGVQSDLLRANGIVTTANVGEAVNYGVTLAATLRPTPEWRIEARATVQRPRLTRPAAVVAGTAHAGLPSVPDVAANLTTVRELSLGTFHTRLEATARYVGRARLSFDPGLERTMGDYALLDLGVAFDRGGWRWAARATNLLDIRANSFGFGNPFTVGTPQRTPVQPRTVSITIGRSF